MRHEDGLCAERAFYLFDQSTGFRTANSVARFRTLNCALQKNIPCVLGIRISQGLARLGSSF
jgi:hypothetical protein